MSAFWSWFIAVFVVINLLGCIWLLWFTSRRRAADGKPEAVSETTGHVWDEDLTELNRPLPRWWINMFYITIVFAVVYMVLYPGFGSFAGTKGWSSQKMHDEEKIAQENAVRTQYAAFAGKSIDALALQPEAVNIGKNIFANHCAACHGGNGKGARGYPNLTDTDWLWGGTPDQVLSSILNGREAVMPGWGAALSEGSQLESVTMYVQSLSTGHSSPLSVQGRQAFESICASCHGKDGKGNTSLGAPNLTDNVWLYGNEYETLLASIGEGRNGVMPAHSVLIGDTRARLVGAYVWSLSHPAKPSDKKPQ
jgi:cytochrome c oxidase cbb3-type subunit III